MQMTIEEAEAEIERLNKLLSKEKERFWELYDSSMSDWRIARDLRLSCSFALHIASHDEALGYKPATDERITKTMDALVVEHRNLLAKLRKEADDS